MDIQSANIDSNIKQQQKMNNINSMKSDLNFANELESLKQTDDVVQTDNRENNVSETANKETNNNNSKVNQSDDKVQDNSKDVKKDADKDNKGADVINNDFNVEKNKGKLPQLLPNMNFGGDGQPFSSFMNNQNNNEAQLAASAKDLAEEAAVLSTMAENIMMANRGNLNNLTENIEISNKDGIKKVNTESSLITDIIVQYDTIIMNEADIEVFNSLVNGIELNFNNLSSEAVQKSASVSKTLADLLAKAMNTNKPVRIEFDNGISVIIKISRDGKLSADFLPSTQVAEAYLKENLPLLKQKFSEQNLDYEGLNQKERRNPNKEQNQKKGRENE